MKPGALCAALLMTGCYHPAPPLPTWSAPAPTPAAAAGCEALVTQVLARHPALEAARRGEAVARAEARVLVPSPFPDLRIRDDVRSLGEDTRLGLRWALPRPGVGDAADAAGEAGVQLSRAELRLAEARLAAAVRRAHLAWRRSELEAQAATQRARQAAVEQAFVERRRAAGLGSAVATSRVALDTQVAEAEAAEAEARHQAAAAVLSRYAGGTLPGTAPCQPTQGEPDDHPLVEAARAQAARSEARAEVDRRQAWAWPGYFEVLYDREPDQPDRALLGFSFDLGKPFETDRTGAVRAQAVAQLAATRRAVADRLAEARASLDAARATRRGLPDGAAARALLTQADAAGADPAERLALERALDALALRRARAALAVEAAGIEVAEASGRARRIATQP